MRVTAFTLSLLMLPASANAETSAQQHMQMGERCYELYLETGQYANTLAQKIWSSRTDINDAGILRPSVAMAARQNISKYMDEIEPKFRSMVFKGPDLARCTALKRETSNRLYNYTVQVFSTNKAD